MLRKIAIIITTTAITPMVIIIMGIINRIMAMAGETKIIIRSLITMEMVIIIIKNISSKIIINLIINKIIRIVILRVNQLWQAILLKKEIMVIIGKSYNMFQRIVIKVLVEEIISRMKPRIKAKVNIFNLNKIKNILILTRKVRIRELVPGNSSFVTIKLFVR